MKIEVVKCPQCGKKWTRTSVRQGRVCNQCRYERQKKNLPLGGVFCGKAVSTDTIMSARTCPRGCSAVRWRIELRRRANPEYFAMCGN